MPQWLFYGYKKGAGMTPRAFYRRASVLCALGAKHAFKEVEEHNGQTGARW